MKTTVEHVMTREVITLGSEQPIHDAATTLADNHISAAPVVKDGKVLGMVSEIDLLRAVMPPVPVDRGLSVLDMFSLIGRAKPMPQRHTKVKDVMSLFVIQIPVGTSIWKAAEIMDRRGIKRLPIVDENENLVGIVSRADLVKAIGRSDEEIALDALRAITVLGEDVFDGLTVEVENGIATVTGSADRRSTKDLAAKIAARTPGVTEVVDRLEFGFDDSTLKNYRLQQDPKDPRMDWEKVEVTT